MSEELIAKWLDDRRSLDESEAAELHRVLSADPALRQNLHELLSLDDLLSRRLSVDRRYFENQVAQRLVGSGSEGSFLKSTLDAVEQWDQFVDTNVEFAASDRQHQVDIVPGRDFERALEEYRQAEEA